MKKKGNHDAECLSVHVLVIYGICFAINGIISDITAFNEGDATTGIPGHFLLKMGKNTGCSGSFSISLCPSFSQPEAEKANRK